MTGSASSSRLPLAILLAAVTALVAVLAAGLRPDAFFVGDPGVKLIATRNAVSFPSHPLSIPLPQIGGTPLPHVEAFFDVHDLHAHAVTSELFPLMSAPLFAALGIRGLYVLPAAGFIAALAACAWLAQALDTRRDRALVVLAAALGTPFLFYGLEFWEHMPAVAAGTAGATLLLQSAATRARARRRDVRAVGAGLLCGLAILLRPEAACFLLAVIVASPLAAAAPGWRVAALWAAGIALALAPRAVYGLLHFGFHLGSMVPGHVGTNASLLGDGSTWAAGRTELVREWLQPSGWTGSGPLHASSFWSVAPAAVVALASLAWPTHRRARGFLWTTAIVDVLLVVLTAPNDGGGQWGPRYLLFAYVPLAILAADLVEQVPRRRAWGAGVLIAMLLCSVWVQRAGYRQLRGTKNTYGRIVDFVGAEAPRGGTVVTDVWWLDQLAAAAVDDRTVLVARDPVDGPGILRRLDEHKVEPVVVVRSREMTGDVTGWNESTCYVETARDELSVRGVVAIRLTRDCATR
jgi:hypothetical protein